MTTLNIGKGRLLHTYDGQHKPQGIYCDIYSFGTIWINWDPEIGNTVPANVWNNVVIRLNLSRIVRAKTEARDWYRRHKALLRIVSSGMGTKCDGNNTVGTLTDDARKALDEIEMDIYKEEENSPY